MPDALPAVTVPSFLKAGFNFAMPSTLAPKRGYSSWAKVMSPFLFGMMTGKIYSANFSGLDRGFRLQLRFNGENILHSRVMPNFSATFSAVMPI